VSPSSTPRSIVLSIYDVLLCTARYLGAKICGTETFYLGAMSPGADPHYVKMSLSLLGAKHKFSLKKRPNYKKLGFERLCLKFEQRPIRWSISKCAHYQSTTLQDSPFVWKYQIRYLHVFCNYIILYYSLHIISHLSLLISWSIFTL